MRRSRITLAIRIVATLLAVSVAILVLVIVARMFEDSSTVVGGGIQHKEQIVTINGEKYREKKTVNYLLIGVDKYSGTNEEGILYYNTQQADFLAVLSVDTVTKEYTIVHINRDTMVDYKLLGMSGYTYGTTHGQIALSHTQGNTAVSAAKNTVDAVKNYLYQITIDYYITLTMDAIPQITDEVVDLITGTVNHGVPITLKAGQSLEGFGLTQSSVVGNVLTLHGVDALRFVRARGGVEDQTNVSRMGRQRQFIEGFIDLVYESSPSDSTLYECYDRLSKSGVLTTNADLQKAYDMLRTFMGNKDEYKSNGIVNIEGTTEIVEGHIAFVPDKENLREVVTSVFYSKY